MKEKYADILFPLALENLLTYRIPESMHSQVETGCQVIAPVGHNIHPGVIRRIRDEPPEGSLPESIRGLVPAGITLPLIPEKTLLFWEWIARYYMCPPGLVAKMALNLWNFKRRATSTSAVSGPLPEPGPPLYLQRAEPGTSYREYVRRVLDLGGQCLVVCPDRFSCESLHEAMLPAFGEMAICFHSKRPLREQSKAKKELYAGNPCVVTGMHLSLLLPFTRLGLVIVDREEHPSHKKSDAVPFLQARDAALVLGRQFHAQVILGSSMPSLETFYNIEKGKFGIPESGPALIPLQDKPLLIDTSRSLTTGSLYDRLEVRTRAAVKQCLEEQKKVILAEADPYCPEDLPQEPGIIVCRPLQLHHHLDSATGLICFLHMEKLLARKHFRATEQTCHLVENALRWAAAQTFRVPVIVQTSCLDHPFYQFLNNGFDVSCLTNMLQERKKYGYPPYTRQLLITVFHNRKSLARDRINIFYSVLQSASLPVRTDGPFVPSEVHALMFSYRLQVTIPRTVNAQQVKDRILSLIRETPLAPARIRIDVDPA